MGLIADVFEVLLIKDNGDVLASSTIQTANIDIKVKENEVRGGRGNNILYTLHSGRDILVTLDDPEFRYDILATQLGSTVVTGAGTAYAPSKWYTLDASKTITLDGTPLAGSLVIYDATGKKLVITTDYTVATGVVTFVAAGLVQGSKVEVRTYQYTTSTTTESIDIDATKFATGLQLVLETIEIDEDENVTHKIQYQFPNATPDGNFKIDTKAERTGSSNQMVMKIIKPKDSDLVGTVLRIPVV